MDYLPADELRDIRNEVLTAIGEAQKYSQFKPIYHPSGMTLEEKVRDIFKQREVANYGIYE